MGMASTSTAAIQVIWVYSQCKNGCIVSEEHLPLQVHPEKEPLSAYVCQYMMETSKRRIKNSHAGTFEEPQCTIDAYQALFSGEVPIIGLPGFLEALSARGTEGSRWLLRLGHSHQRSLLLTALEGNARLHGCRDFQLHRRMDQPLAS